MKQIYEANRFEYKETCENCGKITSVWTQQDDSPEYVTHVFLKCQCGDYIKFILPVN